MNRHTKLAHLLHGSTGETVEVNREFLIAYHQEVEETTRAIRKALAPAPRHSPRATPLTALAAITYTLNEFEASK